MASEKVGSNPLEQFVLLAKTVKGAAAVSLIQQVLEAPGVYVFGELLDTPGIKELATGPQAPHYNLLNVFAYGTYKDYKANEDSLPKLSPAMLTKLRHLTIVSLATKSKCIPYQVLLQELEIQNVRTLEDLIIEVIYVDIIRGKLDQKHQQLEIDHAIGRDIRPEAVLEIVDVLQDWCNGCEAVLKGIEEQISKANQRRESSNKRQQCIEQEVTNIKKTLKTQSSDLEEQMVTDSREVTSGSDKGPKKPSKLKGFRGSNKAWK